VLKAIGQAFDEAWEEVASTFGRDLQDSETARMTLASAVLSIADEDTRNVEVLKVPRCSAWRSTIVAATSSISPAAEGHTTPDRLTRQRQRCPHSLKLYVSSG